MKFSRGALAIAVAICLSTSVSAQQHPDITGLWTRGGAAETPFRPPASGPGPVMTLKLPGQRVPRLAGDYNAPILQPWAAAVVRKQSDAVRAGATVNAPQEMCAPMGVPYILELNFHTQIIDDGKQIVFLYERHGQPRIARLNGTHPANLKPSWFGDSVAHYEGDTLVVDTVGLNAKTWTDNFATPHTEKLHGSRRLHHAVVSPGSLLQGRRTVARSLMRRKQYRRCHRQTLCRADGDEGRFLERFPPPGGGYLIPSETRQN